MQGMHLTASMRLLPKQYPRIAIQLIEVGERTGTLPRSIRMVSEFYEEQLDRDLAVVSAALEPTLLIITGCIVGFVALAVISPMYSITQSFSL
jgi:type IV pilus assembly protein PilC